MAGVNSTNTGLALTNYLDDISETLNHKAVGRLLCKKEEEWRGTHLEWRVHVGRNSAISPTDDGGAIPVADKQDYIAARAYRRMAVGAIQITDGAMAACKKSKAVARDVVESEIKGVMRDFLKFDNYFFLRDGTGVCGTVMVNYAGGTPTLVEVDDARGLWEGATVQLRTVAGVLRGNLVISSIAEAPDANGFAQVTVAAGNVAMIATDILCWNQATGTNTITGLQALINTGEALFQNVVVTSFPHYGSLIMANGNVARDLTPGLFRQMLAGLRQKSGQDRPSVVSVLGSNWDLINVEELYEGELRLSPGDTSGGLAVASFNSTLGRIDIITDTDAPYGQFEFADFSQIHRGVQRPLDWRRDGPGGAIFKRSDVATYYTANVLEVAEYFIKERHTSGRIEDLNYTPVSMY